MSLESLRGQQYTKIHFLIRKKVDFGQAIYVVGNLPELGGWTVHKSLRLTWNFVIINLTKDDQWSGTLRIAANFSETIEFKYVIGLWD